MQITIKTEHLFYVAVFVVAILVAAYHNGHIGGGRIVPLPTPAPMPQPPDPHTLEQQAAVVGATIPVSERQSLANSFELAADDLIRGTERLHVNEDIRAAIAQQPTSGEWIGSLDKILQNAASPDSVVFAENLRQIAKGLKR